MRRPHTARAATFGYVLCLLAAVAMPALARRTTPYVVTGALSSPTPEPVVQPLLPYPAEEDWSFLARAPSRRDPFDAIKFIPIDRPGAYVSLGGEERTFYEAFVNEGFGAIPRSDAYVESRAVLHAEVVADSNVRLYASLQTAALGHRPGGPRPAIDRDDVDLLEGFAEYRSSGTTHLRSDGFFARVGRQQLDFGSGRLFSGRAGPDGEGPNVLGSFDGVRFAVRSGAWRFDAFGARPIDDERGSFDDGPSAGNATWGTYATRGGTGGSAAVDAYYFGVARPDAAWYSGAGFETRHTVGIRFWKHGTPTDYDLETFYQFGTNGSRRIAAEGLEAQIGHTFAAAPLAPRLSALAGYDSGGGDARSVRDMYPPFPRGGYFGNLRAIGPQNTFAAQGELELDPTSAIDLGVGSYVFWRSNVTDGIYDLGGAELAPPANANRYIGYQPFVTATWHATPHLSAVLDYESFQRGDFLRHTPRTLPIHYLAAWTEFRF